MTKSFGNAGGNIFIGDNIPPNPPLTDEERGQYEADSGDAPYYFPPEDARAETVLYERLLVQYADPTSPPHTRKKCVKWAYVGPIKTCVGWKFQYRWLYREAILRVTTNVPTNIGKVVEECLKEAAIAAAIAAIVSGGSAAAAAAETAIKYCLVRKIGEKLISVSVTMHSRRGPWE